jgi:hypothetical protein
VAPSTEAACVPHFSPRCRAASHCQACCTIHLALLHHTARWHYMRMLAPGVTNGCDSRMVIIAVVPRCALGSPSNSQPRFCVGLSYSSADTPSEQ